MGQVRVGYHRNIAGLEGSPKGFPKFISQRPRIDVLVHESGFSSAAIDLTGYRPGNMDEELPADR